MALSVYSHILEIHQGIIDEDADRSDETTSGQDWTKNRLKEGEEVVL